MVRIINALLFLGILGNLTGQTWLKKIHPPAGAGKYSITPEAGRFVYQTKSFRIVTFKKHDHTLMTDFTKCLESIPLALQNIPVPLYAPSKKQKGQLLIVGHNADYLAAGGAENTAGYYDGTKNQTLINWTHFRNNTTPTRVLQEPAFDLIIHELTHLSMHNLMWKCQPWLTEGNAEWRLRMLDGEPLTSAGSITRFTRESKSTPSPDLLAARFSAYGPCSLSLQKDGLSGQPRLMRGRP